jgi:hypothetical protein
MVSLNDFFLTLRRNSDVISNSMVLSDNNNKQLILTLIFTII